MFWINILRRKRYLDEKYCSLFPVIKNNCFEQQFGKMCSETKDTIHYSQGGNQLAIIYKWIAVKMWYQIQAESKLWITQKNTSMDYIKTVTPFSLICEHWLFPLSSPILWAPQHRDYICYRMHVLAVSCLNQKFIWGMRSYFNQKGQIPSIGATSI